jgi:hypothetical protein
MTDQGFGGSAGVAMLGMDAAMPARALRFGRAARFSWTVDLGADVGSRTWWRGLFTCTALCGSALAFLPMPGRIVADGPRRYAPSEWQEARSLSIAPLGLGADTGRG